MLQSFWLKSRDAEGHERHEENGISGVLLTDDLHGLGRGTLTHLQVMVKTRSVTSTHLLSGTAAVVLYALAQDSIVNILTNTSKTRERAYLSATHRPTNRPTDLPT